MLLANIQSVTNSAGLGLKDPTQLAYWDEQLATIPGATFFHSAAWTRVLKETYGYKPEYVVTEREGKLKSVLPIMEVDSWLTGRRGIALPFTDLADPLCPDAQSFDELFQAAKDHGRKRGWKYLELRGGKKWLPAACASTSFLNHVLPLNTGEGALLAGCEDSVRRAIRKAEKSDLQVEFSQSLDSMQAFYRLLCLTRRRHGVPPQPFPFFASIQRHVLAANQGWIVLARHAGEPVAGAIYFHFGRQAIYKFGASDENKQHLRANNLLMWRAIQHYASEGFASLDFGRTSLDNTGLRKFKLGWGAREEALDYLRFDFRQNAFTTARDEASGWHNRVFRTLPLSLSRLAGSLLYRHIA